MSRKCLNRAGVDPDFDEGAIYLFGSVAIIQPIRIALDGDGITIGQYLDARVADAMKSGDILGEFSVDLAPLFPKESM